MTRVALKRVLSLFQLHRATDLASRGQSLPRRGLVSEPPPRGPDLVQWPAVQRSRRLLVLKPGPGSHAFQVTVTI